MDFTVDPKVDVSEATTVTLGGRDWLVVRPMLRQLTKIWPYFPIAIKALGRMETVFAQWQIGRVPDDERPKEIDEGDLLERLDLSEVEIEAIVRVIHGGLSRVYRGLTLDDLEDMPIPVMSLLPALRAVVMQSQATETKRPGEA